MRQSPQHLAEATLTGSDRKPTSQISSCFIMSRQAPQRDFSPIIAAAQQWINKAVINDGSVLSAESLWTLENARELDRAFVQRPETGDDSFLNKLDRQLSDATPTSIRLMAEMVWITLLFPSRITPDKKRQLILHLWSRSGATLDPRHALLTDDILQGIGSAGLAFNSYRARELQFLIALVIDVKAKPPAERAATFRDYKRFVAEVSEREDQGHRQLRHMLRYFAFPDRVERVASSRERRLILHGLCNTPLRELSRCGHAELDDALLKLRTELERQNPGKVIDFYDPELRARWSKDDDDASETDPDDPAQVIRSLFQKAYPDFIDFGNPGTGFSRAELDRKRKALDRFSADGGRKEVRRLLDVGQPVEALRFIRRCVDVNLASYRSWREFEEATPKSIAALLRSALEVTADAYRGPATVAPLFEVFAQEGIKPIWDALSVLLWGLRPEDYFPIKVSYYRPVAELLQVPLVRVRVSPASLHAMLEFGRHVREILQLWRPKDWVDVQSFLWTVGCKLKDRADNSTGDDTDEDESDDNDASGGDVVPERMESTGPTNLILYGPPGTGKTFRLLQLMKQYEDPASMVDEATWLQGVLSHVGWRPVIAATLHQLGGSAKVAVLLDHSWIKAKAIQRGRTDATPAMLWGYLQEHTPESVETVKAAVRRPPYLFTKSEDSVWRLLPDWEQADPVSADLARTLKAGPRASTKTVKRYRTVTFHPSYNYEDFVRGIRPVVSDTTGEAQFEPVNGVFKQLCDEARANPGRRFALFIDEINRGNIAKIFGELITLIEPDKRITVDSANRVVRGVTVQLPGSDPEVDSEAEFGVPDNVDIYGTMNTADRSVAMLDIALRRRFRFQEVEPDYTVLIQVADIDLPLLLRRLNDRLEYLLDRDHRVGHAYLCKVDSLAQLQEVFARQVIPLLQEYFFDDLSKVALTLTTSPDAPAFVVRRKLTQRALFGDVAPEALPFEREVFEITPATTWTAASFMGLYA